MKNKNNREKKIVLAIIICIAILVGFAFGTYKIIQAIGKSNLVNSATSTVPEMESKVDDATNGKVITTDNSLKEGEVLYKGKKYAYNSDIMSFLIMGIDEDGDMEALLKRDTGGQADMLFLAVLNPKAKNVKLIGINRNTMAEINRCDENLKYYDTIVAQLAMQHAYGTGGVDSCEKTVAAVDKLMYMVPIHGYFSMNMGAIIKLNDAIGGVEVKALESVRWSGEEIKEGENVLLTGKKAYMYTKVRDVKKPGSADGRFERQKQYLNAFVNKTKPMIKKDLATILNLYNIVGNYSATDITIDKMLYVVSQAVEYDFDIKNIVSLPGETIHPEGSDYDEFWVDEDALYDMIIDIFYEPMQE